ncbi:MAG: 4-(cytidine 5'-diphospho)-2-C-methyl-D-erythritol kinase [Pyrinomonadaceae bacterium]|nr:4-(cytidine 5'-diphospho)-2-C-methyl-D-erythritol kinase [Pyrinomonadaceae bacterium]
MSFSLPSFAKINWTLRVLGKRDDGFHELFTVFQTVSLCDVIYFAESEKLELTCEDAAIPTDGRNLIVQAARALQRVAGLNKGAFIHLEKRIPSPGGLGGGSSNAAVALIGLMQLWDVTVGERELNEIALELGSDVPFFLQGGTAIGTGRGEVIETIDDREVGAMLIVTPDVNVSTREAFAGLDAATLTNVDLNRILPVCRKDADGLDPLHSVLTNDFERSVFSAYPEIGRVKKTLIDLGAITAAMSGSGASVFAVFDKKETRQAAEKALDREITWRKFVVSTISRTEYSEALRR